MDLANKFVLEDLKAPLSKVLNTSLFAKQLTFYYKEGNATTPLDSQKPLGDNNEINFQKIPIEIEIKIEHIGA